MTKGTQYKLQNNSPIIVLGGTHYDAALGEKHLRQYDIKATPIGLSETPIDQTLLQSYDQNALYEILSNKLNTYTGAHVIVYCNSLSFALDWERAEQLTRCHFYSLTNVYDGIGRKYNKIALISANSCMLDRASSYLTRLNPGISIMGFSYLPIICKIEQGDHDVPDILISTIDICVNTGVEAIIMGCTHFENIDVIHSERIQVIYPGKMLLDALLSDTKASL